jgi:pimeloyl-ACP methyl ester carboxylesterase
MRSEVLGLVALLAALAACGAPANVPAVPPGPPLDLATGGTRSDLRFSCSEAECAGWLFRPARAVEPPIVVMGHGFAGTRDVGLPWFAERLTERGIAVLVIDYRGFGASGGAERQLVDPWHHLEDWRSAIAFARTLPGVDSARIGLVGSSLGAGHAILAAAGDAEVRAVVGLAPLVDSGADGEVAAAQGAGWIARLLFSAWADLAASAFGSSRPIPAIARSGDFGMLVDDAAYAAFEALVAPGLLYRNEVAARSVLTFDDWNPAARAGDVKVPVLLVASPDDRFAPFSAAKRWADSAPNVEIAEIPGDHFDVYSPPVRERAEAAAGAFLVRTLAR